MDAKTRDLALLTALALFCAGVAWSSDYLVLSSVFFVLGGVAAVEIVCGQLIFQTETVNGQMHPPQTAENRGCPAGGPF